MIIKIPSSNVSIVIVNWNGKEDTVKCINSIRHMDKRGYQVSVIVVDNGSTNDSVKTIRLAHPWVTILETKRNLGFTGGNNKGIQYALQEGADIIWLLNNDTIVDRNVLIALDNFRNPHIGAVGSKIYFAAGHEYHHNRYLEKHRGKVIWYAGGIIDWDNVYATHRGVDEVDRGQYDTLGNTPFISGCSLFVKREIFEKIGILDDRFYLYLEDLDFCLRVQSAGYSLFYDPRSILWHVNAGSSGGAGNPLHDYYLTRNRLLIGFQYASFRTKLALIRESMKFLITGSLEKRKAVMDVFFGRWGNQYEPKKYKT